MTVSQNFLVLDDLDSFEEHWLGFSFYFFFLNVPNLGLFAVFLMARPGSGFLVNNIQRSEIAFSEHSFTLFKR